MACPMLLQDLHSFQVSSHIFFAFIQRIVLDSSLYAKVAVGSCLSFPVFLIWDAILRRAQAQRRAWAFKEEFRRLPLACIGGPLYGGAVFWLGWTASSSMNPIVPIFAGLPFGMGLLLIFMALINYLADAYEIYAASALAAASCTRSICGAVLPLAASPMYARLGVHWATSLLGFASLTMALVPFCFIKWGDYLRKNSKFSRTLKEKIEAKNVMECPEIITD